MVTLDTNPNNSCTPVFPIPIPDFIQTDQTISLPSLFPDQINPGRGQRRRIRSCERWLYLLLVNQTKSSPVLIPDKLIAACTWGATDWPRDWRQVLREEWGPTCEFANRQIEKERKVASLLAEAKRELTRNYGSLRWQEKFRQRQQDAQTFQLDVRTRKAAQYAECREDCPFSGLLEAHDHYVWEDRFHSLGALEHFAERIDDTRLRFNFEKRNEDGKLVATDLRTDLYHAYLPIQLFGHSPRVKIPRRQQRLMQGIMRELSLTPKAGRRLRETAWIEDGFVMPPTGSQQILCPALNPSARYANFGGNRKHYRGYQIIGRTRSGWLYRAGYPVSEAAEDNIWAWVRFMLNDLEELSERFEFIAVAVSKAPFRWFTVDEMLEMTRTPHGRRSLLKCRLRIFAPQDYLSRWRRWFADRLGYSGIPGGAWQPAALPVSRSTVDPHMFRAWMRREGIRQKQLADALDCSTSRVSQLLSGTRPWNSRFQRELCEFQDQWERTRSEGRVHTGAD